MKIVGNNNYQKEANTQLILKHLRKKSFSRLELAEKLGLQASTLTYSTNRLLEGGLIVEKKLKTNSQGRPRVLLSLNKDFGVAIGLEILARYCRIVILDLCGTLLFEKVLEYKKKKGGNDKPKEVFIQLVRSIIDEALSYCQKRKVIGCCLAVPGIVTNGGLCIEDCWTHNLKDTDISELSTCYPFPVRAENDANCCVVNVLRSTREKNFVYVYAHAYDPQLIPRGVVSVGIGYGIVINGSLYHGSSFSAGEIRSVFCSQNSKSSKQLSLSKEEILLLDKDAAIQRRFIIEIIQNLSYTQTVLDPSLILLGGELSLMEEVILDVLKKECKEEAAIFKKRKGALVVVSDSKRDACEGAASFILESAFSIPHIGEQSQFKTLSSLIL